MPVWMIWAAPCMALLLAILAVMLLRRRERRAQPGLMLACVAGADAGAFYRISDEALLIGRATHCPARIDDPDASREHAILQRAVARLRLRDLGSANGTWIDGRRVFDELLAPGDQFQIGHSVFAVLDARSEWPSPRAMPPDLAEVSAAPLARLSQCDLDEVVHVGQHFVVRRAVMRAGCPGDETRCNVADSCTVAVKFLNDTLLRRDPDGLRASFARHLRAGMALKHALVAPIYGGDDAHEPPYLIEAFAHGGSLAGRMRERVPQHEALRLMHELSEALSALHDAGLAHGALTAGDVLIGADNRILLANVGLARLFAARGGATARSHAGAGATSDMRAFASLACQLLGCDDANSRPAPGKSAALDDASVTLPRELRAAIHLTLGMDARRRVLSAREFAQLIAEFRGVDGLAAPACDLDKPAPALRPIRLHVAASRRIVPVTGTPMLLGRDMLNPADREISRWHAELYFTDNAWHVRPMPRAANGVLVRGQRIDGPCVVDIGDELVLGSTALRVVA